MKAAIYLWFTLFFILVSNTVFAQFPIINTNLNVEYLSIPQKVKDLALQSDFVIIYGGTSYWQGESILLKVIGYKKKEWYKASFTQKKKSQSGRLKIKNANKIKAEQLIHFLDSIKFWTINKDSLNIRTKRVSDSTLRLFSRSDGANYSFDIISNKKVLNIQAYEPEYYLKEIPEITVRKTFIAARDKFKQIFEEL